MSDRRYKLIRNLCMALLLLIGCILFTTARLLEKEKYGVVLEESQLSNGPDSRSGSTIDVMPGEKVKLLEVFNDYYKVELLNQELGYIKVSALGEI